MKHIWVTIAAATLATLFAGTAQAATLPGVGEFFGAAGFGSANGIVGPSPVGGSYVYITTTDGLDGVGQLAGAGGSNGTLLTTFDFAVGAGDTLEYYFNYITSDGEVFTDYAWTRLVDATTDAEVALLFTARTQPTGSIVPGTGLPLPSPGVTLDPASVEIVPGGPPWGEIGMWSGACYDAGCGFTGWVRSSFEIAAAGTYYLEFGVTNLLDRRYDSGLAIAGVRAGDVIIIPDNPGATVIPLPASAWMLGAALSGLLALRTRRG